MVDINKILSNIQPTELGKQMALKLILEYAEILKGLLVPIHAVPAMDRAIELLEQESKTERFARWVATEIFDEMWEYTKDTFAEIACRKLEKLGIVRAKGDEWVLVDSKEGD